MMKGVGQRGEGVLGYGDHFVFALVDGAFDPVGFVVVHSISDREATHKIADARFDCALIFAKDEVKMIGE